MAKFAAMSYPDKGEPPYGPEVDVFFADDSRQDRPSRPGMGPLVAIGGINVPAEEVGNISRQIDDICEHFGFPPKEEFKWSPSRDHWMYSNLHADGRRDFSCTILNLLRENDVIALVVIEDTSYNTATSAPSPEVDVVTMFLERVDKQCVRGDSQGFVIVDRPGGDRRDETKFLATCLETLQSGTTYVKPRHIAHNVISTPSHLSRLIQSADLVTSCTLATVSGEQTYAPAIFEAIRPLLDRDMGRVGGIGVKIHPDYRYANLYHWVLQDSDFCKRGSGSPLPLSSRAYSRDPFVP
jgi:hypothetical protein